MLQTLRSQCEQRDIPIISKATEQFLQNILVKHKPKICLEIWWAVWYSGIFMGWVMQQRWGKLYSFEISYPWYREGRYHAIASQSHNLISYPYNVLQVPIEKFIPQGKLDFVFIDWQKSEYGAYLAKVADMCSDKTVIVIDDVIKYHHKLSSLYRYLDKKQINCVRTSKGVEKRKPFGWENHTGDLRNRKRKWKVAISDFENNLVYKIIKIDEDDGVMIIGDH